MKPLVYLCYLKIKDQIRTLNIAVDMHNAIQIANKVIKSATKQKIGPTQGCDFKKSKVCKTVHVGTLRTLL